MTDRRFLRRVPLLVLPALLLVLSQPARADDTAVSPEIEKILALPEDKIDIGLAALTFAHEVSPDQTDIQAFSGQIDKLATEAKDLLTDGRAKHLPGLTGDEPHDTILALNEVLYHREGFKYDPSAEAAKAAHQPVPQNWYLPGILARKVGTCATMPMLYMAVAQRLGLRVYGAQSPDHVFVHIATGTGAAARVLNIETTSGGYPARDAYYTDLRKFPDMS